MKSLNAAADDLGRLKRMGLQFEVVVRKISHGVYLESLRRVRDDKALFSCHFEREREILLDVKTNSGLKMDHYQNFAAADALKPLRIGRPAAATFLY